MLSRDEMIEILAIVDLTRHDDRINWSCRRSPSRIDRSYKPGKTETETAKMKSNKTRRVWNEAGVLPVYAEKGRVVSRAVQSEAPPLFYPSQPSGLYLLFLLALGRWRRDPMDTVRLCRSTFRETCLCFVGGGSAAIGWDAAGVWRVE